MSIRDDPDFLKALGEACEGKHQEIQNLTKVDFSKIREEMDTKVTEMKAEANKVRSEADNIRARAETDRLQAFNRVYGSGIGKYAPPPRSIEELRRMTDPAHRDILENLRRKDSSPDEARCPICMNFGHGNKKNGKPWCLKCDAPILSPDKHEEWLEFQSDEPKVTVQETFTEVDGTVKGRLKKEKKKDG